MKIKDLLWLKKSRVSLTEKRDIETELFKSHLDPEKVSGPNCHIEHYKTKEYHHIKVTYNNTNGDRLGRTQTKAFKVTYVNNSIKLDPL